MTESRSHANDAQHFLAQIDPDALDAAGVKIDVTTHDDFTAFVKSKAGVDEEARVARIHEFVTERDAEGNPTQIRIKIKSGEALNLHFPPAGGGSPVAQDRDLTGLDLIKHWIDLAVAASPNPKAAEVAAALVVDGDSSAAAGQDWVPAFATARTEDGVVHLQSRSMFIAQNHPLPKGFTPPPGVLGVHYVAVPAPELIQALVDGTATV